MNFDSHYNSLPYHSADNHVILNDTLKCGVYYHVPTDTVIKIKPDNYTKLYAAINTVKEDIWSKFIFDQLNHELIKKKTTIAKHHTFYETGILSKLTLIVAATCNLNCSYCYADRGRYDGIEQLFMNPDMIASYLNILLENGVKDIKQILFFGGEPLLNISAVESTCKAVENLCHQGKLNSIPQYLMVTNLTICSDKIIRIIHENNISLTVSIDGPKEVHDMQRQKKDGRGSFDDIIINFEKMRQNIKNIEATYTINHKRRNISKYALQEYLSSTFRMKKNNIEIVDVYGNPELEAGKDSDDEDFNLLHSTLDDYQILSAFNSAYQSDLLCNAGYDSICLTPTGDIFPCHMFLRNKEYCMGNITTDSAKLQPVKNESIFNKNINCSQCWARKICHICPAKYVNDPGDIYSRKYCDRRRRYYDNLLMKASFGKIYE